MAFILIFKEHQKNIYENKKFGILKLLFFTEPTDAGIIPPQFRKPHQIPNVSTAANHAPLETNNDKKPHQWSSSPVEEWAKEQVNPL